MFLRVKINIRELYDIFRAPVSACFFVMVVCVDCLPSLLASLYLYSCLCDVFMIHTYSCWCLPHVQASPRLVLGHLRGFSDPLYRMMANVPRGEVFALLKRQSLRCLRCPSGMSWMTPEACSVHLKKPRVTLMNRMN